MARAYYLWITFTGNSELINLGNGGVGGGGVVVGGGGGDLLPSHVLEEEAAERNDLPCFLIPTAVPYVHR